MKHPRIIIATVLLCLTPLLYAKGGFSSSSSGGRGGFSSSSRSVSPVKSTPSVAKAPTSSAKTQTVTRTTTSTSTRTVSRSRYATGPSYNYGGFGMGYGYSNGLLTGLLIGNMLHPYNTVMYAGPGMYSNNALLYPDGRVVNQQGYQVGTYINGNFTAVNGGMVAQNVPEEPQPVVIQNNNDMSGFECFIIILMITMGVIVCLAIMLS